MFPAVLNSCLNMNLNAAITIRYGGTYSATFTSGHISQKVKLQTIPSGYTPVAVLGLNFASTFFTMVGDGAMVDDGTYFYLSARHIFEPDYNGTFNISALVMYVKSGLL